MWASLATAVLQLLVAAVLPEPLAEPVVEATSPPEGATLADLGKVFGYLRQVRLRWLFAYGVALVTLEHVAFTLMQPWLVLVLERDLDDLGSAPVVAGVLFASVSVVGAVAARASEPARRRFGLVPALLGLAAVSAVVVTVMAATQAPGALAVVALRSVQGAAAPGLLSAAIAPVIATRPRATYLSLDSLGGRLGYGALLVAVSPLADDPVRTLTVLAGLSWLLVFGLLFTAGSAAVGHDAG
mgnify:CR=1 FL=1